jgi:tetratricopeptide (TPR) repeat protein
MTFDILLQHLQAAENIEDKAALVAEELFAELDPLVARMARRCALLFWFDAEIIALMLSGESDAFINNAIESITKLPCVEEVSWGYMFHLTTREGLVAKYTRENKDEIVEAWKSALTSLLGRKGRPEDAVAAIVGLVITGQYDQARNYVEDYLVQRGRVKDMDGIQVLSEFLEVAEVLNPTKDSQWTWNIQSFRSLAHLVHGEFDKALALVNQAIELNPKFGGSYLNRANIYVARREFELALADINYAIELDGEQVHHMFVRAELWRQIGNLKRALADYNRILKLEPDNVVTLIRRATAHAEAKHFDQALGDFDRAAELDKDNFLIYSERGMIHYEKKEWDKALADLGYAIEVAPSFSFNYWRRALVYKERKQYDLALADLNHMIEYDQPSGNFLNERAKLYVKLEQFEQALIDIEQALSLDPTNPGILNNRGVIYMELGRDDLAKADLLRSIELDSLDVTPHLNIGNLYVLQREFAKAYEWYQETVRQFPGNYDVAFDFAAIARHVGELDLAVKLLLQMFEAEVGNYTLLSAVGHLLMQQRKLRAAESYIQRAHKFDPDDVITSVNLGVLRWHEARKSEARTLFQKAFNGIAGLQNVEIDLYEQGLFGWLKVALDETGNGVDNLRNYLQHRATLVEIDNIMVWTELMLESSDTPDGMDTVLEMTRNLWAELESRRIHFTPYSPVLH